MQYLSAGTGVMHSEFNPSKQDVVRLLQIWILPNEPGAKPRYGQKSFERELAGGGLVLVASPDGLDGSLAIRQDARVLVARAKADREYAHDLAPGRSAWLQVARGSPRVNDRP